MDPPAVQASPANPKALPWREAIRLSLGISLAARLGLGAVMAAAWLVSLPHLDLGPNPGETLFAGLHWYPTPAGQALLGVWARWDAIHHLNLARLGYFQVGIGESVYYPLYAGLVSAVTRAFVHDYILGGLIVSTLATASALVFLFLLVDLTLGRDSARNAVWVTAVYPTAFFLWAPFTESLFVCLTLAAFLAAYRARGWWAAPAAFLASLARGPGVLSAASLAWIGLKQWRATPAGRRVGAVAGTLVAAGMAGAGGLAFQIWRQGAGFPPMSDILRDYSKLNWIGPLNGAWLAITQLVHKPEFLPIIEMAERVAVPGAADRHARAPALAARRLDHLHGAQPGSVHGCAHLRSLRLALHRALCPDSVSGVHRAG